MARKHKAAVPVSFYVCRRPTFDEALNDCDRPLLAWIESVPSGERHLPMMLERGRIVTETHVARDSAVAQCEAGRYASRSEDDGEPQVRVAIASRLDGQRGRSSASPARRAPSAQVTVPFAPASCPPVPFEVLHRISGLGVNHHPGSIEGEWRGTESPAPNGIGALEGEYIIYSGDNFVTAILAWMKPAASFRSRENQPLFSAWATYEQRPDAPAELLARCEDYEPNRMQINLTTGLGTLRYRIDLINLTTGVTHSTSVLSRWISSSEFGEGGGGLVLHADLPYSVSSSAFPALTAPEDSDGEWLVRVGLVGVNVPGGTVQVMYGGQLWADGVWQHLPAVVTPQPSYAAVAEGYFGMVRRIPRVAVGGRLIDIVPVPGVGFIVRLELINPAPVPACVVAELPRVLHRSHRAFRIVRNLGAGASAELSVLVGSWPWQAGDYSEMVLRFVEVIAEHGALPDGLDIRGDLDPPAAKKFGEPDYTIRPTLFFLPGGLSPVSYGNLAFSFQDAPPVPAEWDRSSGGYYIFEREFYIETYGAGWEPYGNVVVQKSWSQAIFRQLYGASITFSLADVRRAHNGAAVIGKWAGGDLESFADVLFDEYVPGFVFIFNLGGWSATVCRVISAVRDVRFHPYFLRSLFFQEHATGPAGSIEVDL